MDKNKVIVTDNLISKENINKLNIFDLYKNNLIDLIFGIL